MTRAGMPASSSQVAKVWRKSWAPCRSTASSRGSGREGVASQKPVSPPPTTARPASRSSLLLLIYRASHPHVAVLGKVPGTAGQYGDLERHPDNQQLPGIVILRVESGLFFANADAVRQRVRVHAAQAGTRVVVLDAETAPTIDVTAAHMLAELTLSLEREGVRLLVSRQIGQVRDVVRRVATETTPEGVYPTVQAAVQAAQRPPDTTSLDPPAAGRDAG